MINCQFSIGKWERLLIICVFVNESVNNEIPEKKVCLGVYTPKHTFFSGVHTTDQNNY